MKKTWGKLTVRGYGDNTDGGALEPHPLVHMMLMVPLEGKNELSSISFHPKHASKICDAITRMALGAVKAVDFDGVVEIDIEVDVTR